MSALGLGDFSLAQERSQVIGCELSFDAAIENSHCTDSLGSDRSCLYAERTNETSLSKSTSRGTG